MKIQFLIYIVVRWRWPARAPWGQVKRAFIQAGKVGGGANYPKRLYAFHFYRNILLIFLIIGGISNHDLLDHDA